MLRAMPAAALAAAAGLALPFAAQRTLVRRQYLPVVAMAGWLFCANVVYGVNAILWDGSYALRVPAWCDIATKLLIGVAYAVPSCMVCIAARLRIAVLPRDLPIERTHGERRDTLALDLALSLGAPVAAMIIHTIVQDHRFDIIEGMGCQPEIPAVSAGTIFFWLPALVFTLLALFICCIMLRHILNSRYRLETYLELFDRTLTLPVFFAQYTTVLCLSALWTAFLLVTIYEALLLSTRRPIQAINWSRIDQYSWTDFDAVSIRNRVFCWWAAPAAAYAFAFWATLFPVVGKIDGWLSRVYYRIQLRRRSSSVTLRSMGTGKRKGSHVVIRKDSVVTVSYDDGTTRKWVRYSRNEPIAISPVKPAHEPRWSVPWDTLRPFDRRSKASSEGEVVIRELPIAVSPLERAPPPHTLFPSSIHESTRQDSDPV